ncbi:unnamed protein product [Phaeothamnion confervicola]
MSEWDDSEEEGGGYERKATGLTRRALLAIDDALCEPEDEGESEAVAGGPPACEQEEEDSVGMRYIRGDPFANERPDVEVWRRKFPSLLVRGHTLPIEPRQAGEDGESGVQFVPMPPPPKGRGLGGLSWQQGQQQPLSSENIEEPLVVMGRRLRPPNGESPRCPRPDCDDEELIASDGILEEHLAYHVDDFPEDGGGSSACGSYGRGGGGGGGGLFGVARDAARADVAVPTPAASMREELMELLVDELMAQIVPILTQPQAQVPAAGLAARKTAAAGTAWSVSAAAATTRMSQARR